MREKRVERPFPLARTYLTTSVLCACLLTADSLSAQQTNQNRGEHPTITVNGYAASVIPADRASVRVAVETRARTATSAASENARTHRKVLDTLLAIGIPADRIESAGYSVATNWVNEEGRSPRPDGYLASNAVQVELLDLDRIGEVIDAALAAGANRIDGVNFFASQTDSARRAALVDAIAAARRDAETMAAGAGGSLGRLLELSTQAPAYSFRSQLDAQSFVTTEIVPRSVSVGATVYTRWEFLTTPPR